MDMPHERLAAVRERLQRRRRKRAAKRRALQRSEKRGGRARKRAERERRIKEGRPESLTEEAKVAAREAAGAIEEGRAAVSEEQALLAAELGINTKQARSVATQANDLFSRATSAGQLDQFDLDGDGDTDFLQGFEEAMEGGAPLPGEEPLAVDPTEPVIDFSGPDTPLFNEGNRGASPSAPTPGEVTFGQNTKMVGSQTTTMAPNNWRKVVDDPDQLQFEQTDSGDFIVANKQPGGDWKVIARTGRRSRTLGTFDTKQAASNRMESFMSGTSDFGIGGGGGQPGASEQDMLDFTPDLDVDSL